MADQKKRPTVAKARDQKARKRFYLLQVDPPRRDNPDGTWFRVRRIDFVSLVFEGIIPSPLLAAVERLQEARKGLSTGNIASAIAEFTSPENRREFAELQRRVTVAAVLEPKFTHSKRASIENPDLLWAGGVSDVQGEEYLGEQDGDITPAELMTVWKAVAGEADVVTLSADDAESFREIEPATPTPVVRDGEDVQHETVDVTVSADGLGGSAVPDETTAGSDHAPTSEPRTEIRRVAVGYA